MTLKNPARLPFANVKESCDMQAIYAWSAVCNEFSIIETVSFSFAVLISADRTV